MYCPSRPQENISKIEASQDTMSAQRAAKRRRTVGPKQQQQQQQEEGEEEEWEEEEAGQSSEEGASLDAALPLANWHRRGALLEDCLVGDGVLLRELVGIVDGYCGKRFEGRSTELTGHTRDLRSVCAMGDGRLASGSSDNTIRIWDLSKGGECVQTLTGHTCNVWSVCAMGDGRLASGSEDLSLRIWC